MGHVSKMEGEVLTDQAHKYVPTNWPRSWRKTMSATTTFMILSLAPAPVPMRIREPRNELYEVAVACQMHEAKLMTAQTSRVMRRPKRSAHGMIRKLLYPRVMTVTPVLSKVSKENPFHGLK